MGYWPAHPDDPQGIRVASVFEFSECLFSVGPLSPTIHRGLEWPQFLNRVLDCLFLVCLEANFLIFSSFILLFLYSTVQKSAVQYSYWPATIPGHVTTGKKVASVFELHACSLLVSKFSNFSLFHPPLFIQYSTEEYSTVQYKADLERARNVGCRLLYKCPNETHIHENLFLCLKKS